MPIQSLQNIIRVENELYAVEQAEQEKVRGWLQEKEQKIIAEYRGKSGALAGRNEAIKKKAGREAEDKASEIIRDADNRVSRLAGIDDGRLAEIVRKHLPSILSGNFS